MKPEVLSLVLHSFETDSRVLRACRALVDRGYRVKVAALHEGDLPLQQSIGKIEVERVRLWTRSWPRLRFIQVFKYLEWCVRVAWRFRRFGIIHCNDLNTLPTGALLKILSRGSAKVLYDAHEYESNHQANQSRFSIWTLQRIEGMMLRFADTVVTVSEGIANEYARVYGIDRPIVVLNCPRRQDADGQDRFRSGFKIRKDQTIFLTHGWLRPNRGIETLLEAFSSMSDDSKVLVVMGRGILEDEVRRFSADHGNIFYQPVVPPDQVIQYAAAADYGIALIPATSFSKIQCLPNKLFEYLMAKVPVIVSDLPEMRRVVEGMDLGVVCKDTSPGSVVEACNQLAHRDRRTLVENVTKASERFNWDVQQQFWLQAVEGIEG